MSHLEANFADVDIDAWYRLIRHVSPNLQCDVSTISKYFVNRQAVGFAKILTGWDYPGWIIDKIQREDFADWIPYVRTLDGNVKCYYVNCNRSSPSWGNSLVLKISNNSIQPSTFTEYKYNTEDMLEIVCEEVVKEKKEETKDDYSECMTGSF